MKTLITAHLLFILYNGPELMPRLPPSARNYGGSPDRDVKAPPQKAIDGCCRVCDMVAFALSEAACYVEKYPLVQMT